jgi:hypothetical protein
VEKVNERNEDLAVFVEEFSKWLACVNAATTQLLERIGKIFGSAAAKFTWDPSKIKWEEAEGPKGRYERSEDVNSLDFKQLIKDLALHNGRLRREGYFYWLFENGVTCGRKCISSDAGQKS